MNSIHDAAWDGWLPNGGSALAWLRAIWTSGIWGGCHEVAGRAGNSPFLVSPRPRPRRPGCNFKELECESGR